MTKRIRITGPGIHGAPTTDNPTGEYPIGYEFDTDGDLPAGWVGRAVVVGDEPAESSVFVTGNGEGGDLIESARKEVIEKAEVEFKRLTASHSVEVAALTSRAEKAEAEASDLRGKLAAFDRDGDGKTGGAAKQNPPALTGKNKAELVEIANSEGVEIEDGSTNEDIRSAIELAREAAA